ncbi:hypothetical protein CHCC5022_3475 [Bacillus paralicheniformis]|nr:hypothetical protein CHCC5022_3475 [Bacillus paralicheniformis]TWJ70502.1 hypothetical protein CHCC4186_0090 [Bacillus paralicheniformis]TWK42123.1 hypothetical protein CHCC20348_1044 [Bacillus paralicheniformis]
MVLFLFLHTIEYNDGRFNPVGSRKMPAAQAVYSSQVVIFAKT